MRLLVASEVSEGGFWCVHAHLRALKSDKSGCRILDLLEFVTEDVLENQMEENYSSQVLTKQRHRGGFL